MFGALGEIATPRAGNSELLCRTAALLRTYSAQPGRVRSERRRLERHMDGNPRNVDGTADGDGALRGNAMFMNTESSNPRVGGHVNPPPLTPSLLPESAKTFAQKLGVRPLEPKQMIREALRRFGYEIRRTRTADVGPTELPLVDLFDLLVREHLQVNPRPFLVQIGANDGQTEDPVHDLVRRYKLRGLLVEPQPRAFRNLCENYRDQEQLEFENCLLGSADGTSTFYAVREQIEGLPFWLYQSASLDRSVVANALRVFRECKGVSAIPEDYESLIESLAVPSITWEKLLQKHGVSQVDVLVVDTMGFDFEILKLFPFQLMKPSIIHFEHSMLSPADQRAALTFLADHGYSLAKVAVDTIACLNVKTRRWLVDAW